MDFTRIKDLCKDEVSFTVGYKVAENEMTIKIAVKDLLPVIISGTPEEMTEGFVDALIKPLERAVEMAKDKVAKAPPSPPTKTPEEVELASINAEVKAEAVMEVAVAEPTATVDAVEDAKEAVDVAETKIEAVDIEKVLKPVNDAIGKQRWAEALKALNVLNAEYKDNETYIKILAEVEKKSGYDLSIFN